MTTVTALKAELQEKIDWAKKQNSIQGGTYDYTDTTEISALRQKLEQAEAAEWSDKAIVMSRREEWNNAVKSGKTMGDLCAKYGYSYHGKLVAAIKSLGL